MNTKASHDPTATAYRTRFRQLRGNRTMEEFGNAVGLTRQTVSNYELGTRIPGSIDLAKICNACNCTADWLLGLSDARTPSKDIQSACHMTGLSEKAVTVLSDLSFTEEGFIGILADWDGWDNYSNRKRISDILSKIIEEEDFQKLARALTQFYVHATATENETPPELSAYIAMQGGGVLSVKEISELILSGACSTLRDICREIVREE